VLFLLSWDEFDPWTGPVTLLQDVVLKRYLKSNFCRKILLSRRGFFSRASGVGYLKLIISSKTHDAKPSFVEILLIIDKHYIPYRPKSSYLIIL